MQMPRRKFLHLAAGAAALSAGRAPPGRKHIRHPFDRRFAGGARRPDHRRIYTGLRSKRVEWCGRTEEHACRVRIGEMAKSMQEVSVLRGFLQGCLIRCNICKVVLQANRLPSSLSVHLPQQQSHLSFRHL
jgi:hypothetical protein